MMTAPGGVSRVLFRFLQDRLTAVENEARTFRALMLHRRVKAAIGALAR